MGCMPKPDEFRSCLALSLHKPVRSLVNGDDGLGYGEVPKVKHKGIVLKNIFSRCNRMKKRSGKRKIFLKAFDNIPHQTLSLEQSHLRIRVFILLWKKELALTQGSKSGEKLVHPRWRLSELFSLEIFPSWGSLTHEQSVTALGYLRSEKSSSRGWVMGNSQES